MTPPHTPVGTLKNQELFRITRYRLGNFSQVCLLTGIYTYIKFQSIWSLFLKIVDIEFIDVTELQITNRGKRYKKVDP